MKVDILKALAGSNLNMTSLYSKVGTNYPRCMGMLADLISDGLVTKIASPRDGKGRSLAHYQITDNGKHILLMWTWIDKALVHESKG